MLARSLPDLAAAEGMLPDDSARCAQAWLVASKHCHESSGGHLLARLIAAVYVKEFSAAAQLY